MAAKRKPKKKRQKVKSVELSFTEFLKLSDYDIQRVLRLVDQQDLSTALWGAAKPLRECFYRNMSQRAASLIGEGIQRMKQPSDRQILAARKLMLKIAAKVRTGKDRRKFKGLARMAAKIRKEMRANPVSARPAAELVELFVGWAEMARRFGILSLEQKGIARAIDDEYAALGLGLVIDGTDPKLIEKILTIRKGALLVEYERKLDMIKTAVTGMQLGENPRVIQAKCRAYLT